LVVVGAKGPIYSSPDAGATWLSNNAPALYWQAVVSSADGAVAYAAPSNGTIWSRRTTPAPVLGIASGSNSLSVSWLVPSANFVLQQNTALATAGWTDVTNPSTFNLSRLLNEVTIPLSADRTFYRLKMP
jgi:hypothetical protein